VAVSVAGPDKNGVVVARLGEGEFFGEMSLLTGERRSATVTAETDTDVIEVSKPDFSLILQADAALAEKLAAVIDKRARARQAGLTAASGQQPESPAPSAIVARIRKFFGLS
jgi:CRP-like cAMP-binding protein